MMVQAGHGPRAAAKVLAQAGNTPRGGSAEREEKGRPRQPGEVVVSCSKAICPSEGGRLNKTLQSFGAKLQGAYDPSLIVLPDVNIEGNPL
eukprot:2114096-Amphidinium_carterae.2